MSWLSEFITAPRRSQSDRNCEIPPLQREAALWKHLQSRALHGKKFRRQHSIGPYIVDFYCPESRLVIELDGQPHYEFIADPYEAERTAYLQRLGMKILRFENRLIFEALDAVLQAIREELFLQSPETSGNEAPSN